MKNNSSQTPHNTVQRTYGRDTLRFILALMALLLPVIGYCDSENGWYRNLFVSKGKNMKELKLTREVIIKDESGFLPEQLVISRTDDGGFIIAGSLGRAWSIKTDATGKVLWRYMQDKPLAVGGYSTTFTGSVAMPDGSTYLCGNTTGHPGKDYAPALLTRLDAAGQPLNEQLLLPQKRTEHGHGYFDGCVRWGYGIVIVGYVHNIIRQAGDGLGPITENYYWLIMLDASGNFKWGRQIPTTFSGITSVKSILITSDGCLVFAGDGMVDKTELFRISASGDLMDSKILAGQFQFVQPVIPDGMLQLNGHANGVYTSIMLDNRLEETQRVQKKQLSDFFAKHTYRMPDQSLVLFGQGIHSLGERYRSEIAYHDSKLQSAQHLELTHAPYYDGGSIDAAAPTGNEGEFVAARTLLKHIPGKEVSNDARVGVALDFIQIK